MTRMSDAGYLACGTDRSVHRDDRRVNYHLFIGAMERAMHKPDHTAEERDAVEAKLSVLRRVVLSVELLFFAGLGYWIGKTFWG
jgi:hypothetical protein